LLIGFSEEIQGDGQRENSSEESWKATFVVQEEQQEEIKTLQNGAPSSYIISILAYLEKK
jgi:hypothetical protein